MAKEQLSSYELQRLKNIEENRKVLLSLGLLQCAAVPKVTKNNVCSHQPAKKRRKILTIKAESNIPDSNNNEAQTKHLRRRSLRVRGLAPDEVGDLPDDVEKDKTCSPSTPYVNKDNFFGAVPGVPVGTHWEMRIECSRDGIHRPPVAGIHGNAEEGCYSLALSGGYEDDIDMGDRFTYTGEGGRDLKGTKSNPKNLRTAPQSKDQTLTRGNLALSRNVSNRMPVRVIRGYKLQSSYAPEYGYRYDGLYTVEKFWAATGLSGFLVYKFALKRCPDQEPPTWEVVEEERENEVASAEE